MRIAGAVAAVAGLTLLFPGVGRAHESKSLTVAIYAPNAPFSSGAERFAFINRLAQQITSVAGVPAEGKAFARASDLEAAIRAHKVQFAVIDGVYLAERGVPYTVLATATTHGEVAPKWGLFAANATSVKDLQGRKLALAYSGPRDTAFIENALFEGELQVNHFFSGRSTAPDISSAVTAVALKRADAVFAPEHAGKSLKKIFDAGRIPNAAFCLVASGIAPDVVSKVRSAVVEHGAEGPGLDGWRVASADAYRALAARMSARVRRPVMVEPDMIRLENDNVLVAPEMKPGLVDLRSQFWNPAN